MDAPSTHKVCPARPHQARCRALILSSVLALAMLLPATLHAETEAAVKAAYLYNFTLLVKWPQGTFAQADSPIVIGLVGREALGSVITEGLRGRRSGTHPIEVIDMKSSDVAALRRCNIVFIATSEAATDVITAVKGRPVLVVGEDEDFALHGGIIGFVLRGKKVKVEINRESARQAQLSIPSDLLAIARLVN
jgi:hypothetical protein